MRKILALLVLVAGANVAQAVPTAFYNPVNGNVRLFNDDPSTLGAISIISAAGTNIQAGANIAGTTNDSGDLPLGFTYFGFPSQGALSGSLVVDYPKALDAGALVVPGTSLNDLSIEYRVSLSTGGPPSVGAVVLIPEPATVGLAGLGLCGLAVRRRRS